MTTSEIRLSEREELELLLPWYVTGKLNAADHDRVQAWLNRDMDAARLLELAREEQQAASQLSASIPVPPSLTVERTAAYVAQESGASMTVAAGSWWHGLRNLLTIPTPGAVRFAAAALAIVIVLQGMAIRALWQAPVGPYETASGETQSKGPDGTFVLVKFNGGLAVDDMSKTLTRLGLSIVDGPKPGGLFRARIAPGKLSDIERDKRVDELRREHALFELVTPSP